MHLQTFFLQAAVKQKKFVLIQMVDKLRRSVRARYKTDKDFKKQNRKKIFEWFKCTLIKSKNKNMEVEMSKTGPL